MFNIKQKVMSYFKSIKKEEVRKQVRELVILLLIAFMIRTVGFGLYQVPTGSMETTMLVGERFFADKFTVLFRPVKRGDIITFLDPTYEYSKNRFVYFFRKYVDILWGPSNWTKRVVGIPGDRVIGVIKDGKPQVYVNGKLYDEPNLNKYPLVPVSLNTFRSYDPEKPYHLQPFYKMDMYEVKRAQRILKLNGRRTIFCPGIPLDRGSGSDVFDVTLGPNQYWMMGDNRLGSFDSRAWGVLDGSLIHGKILWRIFSVDSSYSWPIFHLLFHPIDFFQRIRWSRCFQAVK